ncbi:MAG: hypothetical protein KJ971_06985 [Firmicutes bacterium]|nr:hypothetical protein [Bacillota bacterium]
MFESSWEQLSIYQQDISRILINSFKYNKLAHAYIFEGPLGTKRIETAFLLAKTLLCKDKDELFNPCGVCHNCKRIDNLTHPNVFYIQAEGEVIKKKQVKELLDEFSKSAIEDGPRVYIINEADRFNQESANTLLKTMEEPGNEIYQILVTDQINVLLKTIVSRAQVLHFKPIDKHLIQKDLLQKKVDPLVASVVSEYTNNYDAAESIANSSEMVQVIKFVTNLYKSLLEKKQSMVIMFKENHDLILSKSDMIDYFLTLMIFYQKDLLNYKLRHLDQIIYNTEESTIEKLSEMISQNTIEDNLDKMLGLKSRLKYNINSQLAFDKMLAHLERGFNYGVSSRSDSI